MKRIKSLPAMIAVALAVVLAFAFTPKPAPTGMGWFPYNGATYALYPDPDIDDHCSAVPGTCAGLFEINENTGQRVGDVPSLTKPGTYDPQ